MKKSGVAEEMSHRQKIKVGKMDNNGGKTRPRLDSRNKKALTNGGD